MAVDRPLRKGERALRRDGKCEEEAVSGKGEGECAAVWEVWGRQSMSVSGRPPHPEGNCLGSIEENQLPRQNRPCSTFTTPESHRGNGAEDMCVWVCFMCVHMHSGIRPVHLFDSTRYMWLESMCVFEFFFLSKFIFVSFPARNRYPPGGVCVFTLFVKKPSSLHPIPESFLFWSLLLPFFLLLGKLYVVKEVGKLT
jgi:hypothetical protein